MNFILALLGRAVSIISNYSYNVNCPKPCPLSILQLFHLKTFRLFCFFCPFITFYFSFFELTFHHMFWLGLQLVYIAQTDLNSWSSCLSLPGTGITDATMLSCHFIFCARRSDYRCSGLHIKNSLTFGILHLIFSCYSHRIPRFTLYHEAKGLLSQTSVIKKAAGGLQISLKSGVMFQAPQVNWQPTQADLDERQKQNVFVPHYLFKWSAPLKRTLIFLKT